MNVEIRLVDRVDELIDQYEDNLQEYKTNTEDIQLTFFRSLEDLEEKYASFLRSLATDLVERAAKEEFPEDVFGEEASSMLMDRDSCLSIVTTSHELRLSRLLKLEEVSRKYLSKRCQDDIIQEKDRLLIRNRNQVLEIRSYSSMIRKKIDSLDALDEDDEVFAEESSHSRPSSKDHHGDRHSRPNSRDHHGEHFVRPPSRGEHHSRPSSKDRKHGHSAQAKL